ncbi:hypothetical protein SGCOL_004460 [Colletotrichum sp. CLE4]
MLAQSGNSRVFAGGMALAGWLAVTSASTVDRSPIVDLGHHKVIVEQAFIYAAPVIVWLHGGSYVLGHKNFAAHPAGLIAKAQEDGSDGVIHVALHYRLGLFGWMSGPAFIEQGGVANLGLRDQRLALEWIWENIHLFSGDPDNVTVLGEFTGGGSILHQLTASSSSSGAPFKRAILKSPGFEPMEGPAKQNLQYRRVLEWASYFSNSTVSSLDDLKQLPFDVL